jgi:hypothetical protein
VFSSDFVVELEVQAAGYERFTYLSAYIYMGEI